MKRDRLGTLLLTLCLSVVLVIGMLPLPAIAEDNGTSTTPSGNNATNVTDNHMISYVFGAQASTPVNIDDAAVAPIPAVTYTSRPLEPKPQVSYEGVLLKEGVDYTLVYADNVDPGTGHVIITGKGNFAGERTEEFAIKGPAYSVAFDANVPTTASTTCTATMEDEPFEYDQKKPLSKNAYVLPGYEFDGWNTKADGAGAPFSDKAEVQGLTKEGGTVTLYAQWTPRQYEIYYESGDEEVLPHTQTATFDKAGTFDEYSDGLFGWSSNGRALLGWTGPGFGSFYADGEDFFNLCGTPVGDGAPPNVTLTAYWLEKGKIGVAVTKNGAPLTDVQNYLKLTDDHGTEYTMSVAYDKGAYIFDPSTAAASGQQTGQLPNGEYDLSFEAPGYPQASARISYTSTSAVGVTFSYHTVSLAKDPILTKDPAYDKLHSVSITGGVPVEDPNAVVALDNGELDIQTTVPAGYHFDRYTALGVTPVWEGGQSKADQTIKVQGKVDITAHVEANTYAVHFDTNEKSGVTGTMEDQDMVYDQSQKLLGCGFSREGHDFVGWNTKADGSGDTYADEQSVQNLTTKNQGTVTLYAQWKAREYTISFVNDDGTELQGGKVAYGQTPKYTGATPTKTATAQYTYEFKEWTPEVVSVTGDATYTATYTQVPVPAPDPDPTPTPDPDPDPDPAPTPVEKGALTFNLGGGMLDGKTGTITIEANVGDTITIPNAPTREGYTFQYWRGSEYYPGDKYTVKGDHTFTAVWKKNASGETPGTSSSSTTTGRTTTSPTTTSRTTTSPTTTNPTSTTVTRSSAIPKTSDASIETATFVILAAFGLCLAVYGLRRKRNLSLTGRTTGSC